MHKTIIASFISAVLFIGPTLTVGAAEERIVIPFSVWKLVLPRDGEVISFAPKPGEPGYNTWPNNSAKGAFEQHEMFEISFGWIMRAKAGDRGKEGPMHTSVNCREVTRGGGGQEGSDTEITICDQGPRITGFTDRKEYIKVVGGWRAHRKEGGFLVEDYFDGTFRARLKLSTNEGRLQMNLTDIQVSWKESLLSQLTFNLMKDGVEKALLKAVEGAQPDIQEGFGKLHELYLDAREESGVIRRLTDATTLSTQGTSIVLAFNTSVSPNPGAYFPPNLSGK